MSRLTGNGAHFGVLPLVALLALVPACHDDGPLSPRAEPPPPPGQVLGLVEVTITGLGNGEATASAISAPDLPTLMALRSAHARNDSNPGAVAVHSVSIPANQDGSGDGTIQFRPVSTGSFTSGARDADGERFIQAVFQVRNATSGGTAYDSPRQNLTFLAVATDATVAETAISDLALFDGSSASAALARQILPTGDITRNTTTGEPLPTGGDVFQAFSEAALAALVPDAPADVNTILPYGFVVRAPGAPDLRTLVASPAPGQYDGQVTFAFRLPLQASASDDPYTISAIFLAVDDTETRTTESLEEQGTTHLATRAQALGPATMVTLLGTSSPAVPSLGIDRLCRLRTAGVDPGAPAATLIDEGADCAAGVVSLPQHVIVVDRNVTTGPGNGRSWSNAFRYLQDALACVRDDAGPAGACEDVTEIWVAEGSHYPDEGAGLTDNDPGADRDHPVSFELVPDVALYGGFAGYETSRQQRDWQTRPTFLDGDIDQDGTEAGNAYRIVMMHAVGGVKFSRASVIDGFILTGADGSALVCAAEGAGSECSPLLRDLIMTGNSATTFTTMPVWGGGVSLLVDDNAIAAPLLEGVTFSHNLGLVGGGLLILSDTTAGEVVVDLVRTNFNDNESPGGDGGAISIVAFSSHRPLLRLQNATLRSNTTSYNGGAISLDGAALEAANVEMRNNEAVGGSAIAVRDGELTLTGATIVGNVATAADPRYGGAIFFNWDEPALITNSIVWGNNLTDFNSHFQPDRFVLKNVIAERGCPTFGTTTFATCTDVQATNPVFRDLVGGDLRLGSGSPAIDAGNNAYLGMDIFDLNRNGNTTEPIPFDIARRPRVVDWAGSGTPRVDLGAHETQR